MFTHFHGHVFSVSLPCNGFLHSFHYWAFSHHVKIPWNNSLNLKYQFIHHCTTHNTINLNCTHKDSDTHVRWVIVLPVHTSQCPVLSTTVSLSFLSFMSMVSYMLLYLFTELKHHLGGQNRLCWNNIKTKVEKKKKTLRWAKISYHGTRSIFSTCTTYTVYKSHSDILYIVHSDDSVNHSKDQCSVNLLFHRLLQTQSIQLSISPDLEALEWEKCNGISSFKENIMH